MFPSPLDEEPELIAVEYDVRPAKVGHKQGERRLRIFNDVFVARRWYVQMFREGRNPKVVKAGVETKDK